MAGSAGDCVMGAPVLVAGGALLVSAGGLFCFMPVFGAGAGECARRRSNFLLLRHRMAGPKKVTKEKATPLSASPALRYGATCGARVQRGLARTRFAQTIASPDPLAAALLGAYRGDGGAKQPNSTSGHCFARPFVVGASALRRAQPFWGRAQRRPEWLFGCSPPAGCACGGAVAGWHGRRSAHASSSDSPWLSERRCAAAKRVPRRTPQAHRRRFAPQRSEGVADWGSPSFAFFSWRRKKRRCAAGRTSRHPPLAKACCQINEQAQASTSSARTGGGTARRSY